MPPDQPYQFNCSCRCCLGTSMSTCLQSLRIWSTNQPSYGRWWNLLIYFISYLSMPQPSLWRYSYRHPWHNCGNLWVLQILKIYAEN
jgi:hypothetical protein